MHRAPRIVCQCGGELTRPLPHVCPHCGAVISSTRRSIFPVLVQLLIVIATFAVLIAFLAWLLSM